MLAKFFKANNWLEGNRKVVYLLLFLICFIFFFWLQYSPTFPDPDSFYHAKIAQLISGQGLILDFPYLPFTTLKDYYIDHHFLYHIYLVPFVSILPPLVGVKLAHIFLDCLVVLVFFWLLSRLKVKGAFWWTLLLLFCQSFVFRISLVKAQPFSLIILFLSVYLILTKRYFWLIVLSFLYVWFYGGWFLILILSLLYILVSAWDKALLSWRESLFERALRKFGFLRVSKIKKFVFDFFRRIFAVGHWKLLGAVVVGLVLGIIINPYFPRNLDFYWVHIIKIAFVNFQSKIGVGAEWYPYSVETFFRNMALPFVVALPALVIYFNHRKKFSLVVKYLLVIFILFILATLKSRRNIEYLIPFAVIFSAVVYSGAWQIRSFRKEFKDSIHVVAKMFFKEKTIKIFLIVVVVGALGYLAYALPTKTKRYVSGGSNFNYMSGASEYLIENSSAGVIVFHSDWDDFPALFFHNNHNYYMAGLDPTFMYLNDSDLYHKWADITLGKRYQAMYSIIKNDFGAEYVLAGKDHPDLIRNLDNNFYFDKVYEDEEAIIYKVL